MSTTTRFAALPREQRVTLLRRLVEAGQIGAIPDIVPQRDPSRPVRLSPGQEDLWVYEALYSELSALNLCCAYHFDGPVAPGDLEAALTIVQEQHDILRMRITGSVDELRADFPAAGPFVLERAELRGPLHDELTAYSRRRFDLSRDRLIRGRFIRVDEKRSTLVLALHHIVTDWFSFDILHREFTAAYKTVRDGTPPVLGRPEIQYPDFASWQRELEEAGVLQAQLGFWRDYLGAPPPPLTVGPLGAPRGPFGITRLPFHIDLEGEAAIRALARERGATVYGVLMTAFAVLAHRLSGQDDMTIGTPVANRAAKGLERVIGYVMNEVPTRWHFEPETTFADLLSRFTADFPRLLDNADVPVGRIVSAIRPERVVGRSPLFQWVFMYLTRQESVRMLQEIAEPERVQTGGEHDVMGIVRDTEDGLAGALEVRIDLYDPEAVRAWADGFTVLLADLVRSPDTPISHAALLSGETPGAAVPRELPATSPADLAVRQAALSPDAVAVESEQEAVTYAELIARADRLAGALRECGAGPERIVALVLGRSVELVVGILAVQRAGAAFLPVDPEYPQDRIAFILRDAAPVAVVADPATPLPETGVSRLSPGDSGRAPLPRAFQPLQAAHVYYTSGSTGTPKGVVASHTGHATLTVSLVEQLRIDASSRILQLSAPTFDVLVGELCMAFGSGGTLVVTRPGPLTGRELAEVLVEREITGTFISPTILASVPPGEYPALRVIATIGEVCSAELVRAWANSRRRFHNTYGPTEGTVLATLSTEQPQGLPPIGLPMDNVGAYVLDARLRPVPVGVPGELYLTGDLLVRGYLNRPGLTAERFVACPFEPGARMYRTGDLARRRPDGQLDFLSRTDDQMKVSGVRVEPGEIEAVLSAHPSVSGAAVALRDGRLIAYVVPHGELDQDALIAHAAARLPVQMVPGAFVELASLPLTRSGKLHRAALPAPPRRAGTRAPAGAVETRLCELFAEFLKVDDVGAQDSFFALGGDSIAALQLVSRAREEAIVLTPKDVFVARTPARLAALAGATSEVATDSPVGRFPLTPIMHRWREHHGPLHAFALSALLPVPDDADAERIGRALQILTERHASLRTRLVRHSGEHWELEVPATAEPVGFGGAALDPEKGRMLQAVWQKEAGKLLLTVHRLAADGVSLRILAAEMAVLLSGADMPPPRGTSVQRWSTLLHEQAVSPARLAELSFWTGMDTGEEARLVPGRTSGGSRTTLTRTLAPEITEAVLTRLPTAYRCGPDHVLLAALTAAAARWRGHGNALLVELEGHGREEPTGDVDLSATVGWFTAQYPVRLEAAEGFWDGAAGVTLKQVKEQLRAVPGGGLGYGMLRYLNPDTAPRLAASPGPDLRFNYLGRFSGGDLEPVGTTDVPTTYAVELDVIADGPHLVAVWSYAGMSAEEAETLADLWFEALGVLAREQGGGSTSSDFPLVELSQEQVDALEAVVGSRLSDILPLSPTQEGMLYRALLVESGPDVYMMQGRFRIDGPVDVAALRRAVDILVERHAGLRACFRYKAGLRRPVQLVPEHVSVPFVEVDGQTMEEVMAADRIRPFDVTRPPLLRAALVGSELLLTVHHLLIDGWSKPLLARELIALYEGETLPPAPQFRDYLAWLRAQEPDKATAAWEPVLAGLPGPTRLHPDALDSVIPHTLDLELTEELSRRLRERARAVDVTLYILAQAAWAMVLAQMTGQDDVVFGTIVSGRPPEIPGIESMIGLFINALPVRVRLGDNLLARLQDEHARLAAHQYVRLADLQRLAGHRDLFDTALGFENYPRDGLDRPGRLRLAEVWDSSHYPLAVMIDPADRLYIRLAYRPDCRTRTEAALIMGRLVHAFEQLADGAE
ncbi:amino acid adenylation domain-containing protein [Streptosporangium jomthongense]|uniref:Amino acid adenylation domain-containing protein n=1 Tax=Streptosporangium jomthongense TaxID=1193683 RepID=A0ABV8FDF2_9ACTN